MGIHLSVHINPYNMYVLSLLDLVNAGSEESNNESYTHYLQSDPFTTMAPLFSEYHKSQFFDL